MKWLSDDLLTVLANAASIITAVVASVAYVNYRWNWCKKKKRLEDCLRNVKRAATGPDKGQRTLMYLVRELGMTESDIIGCAFETRTIARRIGVNKETNQAETLFLEYVGE